MPAKAISDFNMGIFDRFPLSMHALCRYKCQTRNA